jgi:hypothetical protein
MSATAAATAVSGAAATVLAARAVVFAATHANAAVEHPRIRRTVTERLIHLAIFPRVQALPLDCPIAYLPKK